MELFGAADSNDKGWVLRPGEHLLWAGRPDPTRLFVASDAFLIPFSLMWGGFAIFWETSVVRVGAPLPFTLFGMPFVAVGLYLIAGRFFLKRHQRLRTRYLITNQRALIVLGSRSLRDVLLDAQPVSINRSRSGRHVTVTFGQVGSGLFAGGASFQGNSGMAFLPQTPGPFAFLDVAEPNDMLVALDIARRGGPQDARAL